MAAATAVAASYGAELVSAKNGRHLADDRPGRCTTGSDSYTSRVEVDASLRPRNGGEDTVQGITRGGAHGTG
jgi:hypothetical protein